MNRTRIYPDPELFPPFIRPLLLSVPVYDSSSSPEARVYFIDSGEGCYLKSASAGALAKEADMTRYMHRKGLGAEVLAYLSGERDWLLTARLPGEDCTHPACLENPRLLCDKMAEALRLLHDADFAGCPVPNRTADYLEAVQKGYLCGRFDLSLFPPDNMGFSSPDEAWAFVLEHRESFEADTLIHGDYCLPNIILKDGKLSGFIDLGCGGVGDRHIDLFWGAWTLFFNLKTDRYRERFFDAYGRDRIDPDRIRAVAAAELFL